MRRVKYALKGRKFEHSYISDQLLVSVDIHYQLSVIGIWAKFHIGASPGVSNEMRVEEGGATYQALGTRRRGHGWRGE